eukprot:350848-Chlamydomonas_euryale.AAC.9
MSLAARRAASLSASCSRPRRPQRPMAASPGLLAASRSPVGASFACERCRDARGDSSACPAPPKHLSAHRPPICPSPTAGLANCADNPPARNARDGRAAHACVPTRARLQ